jgi:hypothetical protein
VSPCVSKAAVTLAAVAAIAIAFRLRWIRDFRCDDFSQGSRGLRTPADEARACEWQHAKAGRRRQFIGSISVLSA